MAIRNIRKENDEMLRKQCREVTLFDGRLAQLLEDMADTMYGADGVGLAGPQVGVLRRVCVIDAGDGLVELVNPVIEAAGGTQEESEGCLSFPGLFGVTSRPQEVRVRAQDRNGDTFTVTGEGLKARALCHEIDHLDGILFQSRVIRQEK